MNLQPVAQQYSWVFRDFIREDHDDGRFSLRPVRVRVWPDGRQEILEGHNDG